MGKYQNYLWQINASWHTIERLGCDEQEQDKFNCVYKTKQKLLIAGIGPMALHTALFRKKRKMESSTKMFGEIPWLMMFLSFTGQVPPRNYCVNTNEIIINIGYNWRRYQVSVWFQWRKEVTIYLFFEHFITVCWNCWCGKACNAMKNADS